METTVAGALEVESSVAVSVVFGSSGAADFGVEPSVVAEFEVVTGAGCVVQTVERGPWVGAVGEPEVVEELGEPGVMVDRAGQHLSAEVGIELVVGNKVVVKQEAESGQSG